MALTDKLRAIADAIRAKTGKADGLTLDQMAKEIEGIESGSGGVVNISESTTPRKELTLDDFSQLGAISFPNANIIETGAFQFCDSLTHIYLPVAETIGDVAFTICGNLSHVYLPKATTIGQSAFNSCTSLSHIDLPEVETIRLAAFYGCTGLTRIDLPKATFIAGNVFKNCTNLNTAILRTTELVCSVEPTAIQNTPLMTGEGHVYIPAAMYESYRPIYEQGFEELGMPGFFDILFRKIEDYPEICG